MAEVVAADEKSPSDLKSYDLKCTVRHWDGKKFLKPIPNLLAFKAEKNGKTAIYTRPMAGNEKTPKGSEITIGDEVYVVERSVETSSHTLNYVTLKPKDK